MSSARERFTWAWLLAAGVGLLDGCFVIGRPLESGSALRNGGTASELVAREHAGGRDEGRLGFLAPVSRSYLYEELAARGVRAETLGPLGQIRDRDTLMAVMSTFTRSLGVQCNWCHVPGDFAAPTPRKAVAAYMWDNFVRQLEFRDGTPLYCDSCHHGTAIFLRRQLSERALTLHYMRADYVEQLRRRDGHDHGCTTCHGVTVNLRMLPRL